MFSAKAEDPSATIELQEMPTETGMLPKPPELVNVDSKNLFMYTANKNGGKLLQWEFTIGDGNLISLFSPRSVWSAGDSIDLGIRDIALEDGRVFLATSDDRIVSLDQGALIG